MNHTYEVFDVYTNVLQQKENFLFKQLNCIYTQNLELPIRQPSLQNWYTAVFINVCINRLC